VSCRSPIDKVAAAASVRRTPVGTRRTSETNHSLRFWTQRIGSWLDRRDPDGFAIARYDSRDGYGHHQREEQYVAPDTGAAAGGIVETPPAPAPSEGSVHYATCDGLACE
jgi:hypothetical protein